MSNERVEDFLVRTGAFTDLDQPVILASGKLGIYYINTEKLLEDDGSWKKFGDDSLAMAAHLWEIRNNSGFKEVTGILAERVDAIIRNELRDTPGYTVISGGQRRDWLFSIPVASKLGFPHLSLYKSGKSELLMVEARTVEKPAPPKTYRAVHIVDLITEGSSAYSKRGEVEGGWIPMIRTLGGDVHHLLAIVDRQQGGPEMLAEQSVHFESFVTIDESFLREYSNDVTRAVAYFCDPDAWSEDYLREHGALAFVDDFDPNGSRIGKAINFMSHYEGVLERAGKLDELRTAVQERHGASLADIMGEQ